MVMPSSPQYSPHPSAPPPPRGPWRVALYILLLVCVIVGVVTVLRACAE